MSNNVYSTTLLKSFEILDCFASDNFELSIKEISEKIGMPQSSVYRMLKSLEFAGMIIQNKDNKKYRIGPKFILYSNKHDYMDSCKNIAIKYMQVLEEEVGENVNLGILTADKITTIHRVECKHILRPDFGLNTAHPAYKTGLGLILLVEHPDSALEKLYESNSEEIGMTKEKFFEQISEIRKSGFAYDDQAFSPGVRCVAAPIRACGGKAIFSMSVSAPTTRMTDGAYETARQLVIKYALLATEEISGLS